MESKRLKSHDFSRDFFGRDVRGKQRSLLKMKLGKRESNKEYNVGSES